MTPLISFLDNVTPIKVPVAYPKLYDMGIIEKILLIEKDRRIRLIYDKLKE